MKIPQQKMDELEKLEDLLDEYAKWTNHEHAAIDTALMIVRREIRNSEVKK